MTTTTNDDGLSRRRALLSGLAAAALFAVNPSAARSQQPGKKPYPLDDISRRIPARGRVQCPAVELVIYRGKVIRYRHAAKIYVGFRERLERFEQVAAQVGTDVFGRPPAWLVHFGTYSCRRIAAYPTWLSEHALGNAIDILGFDFAALPRGGTLPKGVHRMLRGPFGVRVQPHWRPRHRFFRAHSTFLRTLARRLIERRDIFQVMLGPGFPGHHNHFHFDTAPWRLIEGFEDDKAG